MITTNQLSEREREILRHVAGGLSNQQIANRLGISVNTVKVHLRNVFAKIGVASRAEATMYAVRNGIVPLELAPQFEPADEEELPSASPLVPVVAPVAPPAETPAVPQPAEVVPIAPVVAPPVTARRPARRRFAVVGGVLALLLVGVAAAVAWPRLRSQPPGIVRWQELPTLRSPRAGAAAAVVGNQMYVIGGENQDGVLGDVERYDVGFRTWAQLSRKPTPVTDVRAAVLGGKIYVPGGRRSAAANDIVATFEVYDPRTETWERLPDLPAPRSAYGLAVLEGSLYLFGGWDGAEFRKDVWEYDPGRGEWIERTPMPTARAYSEAVTLGDTIWVLGGENDTARLDVNEAYTPAREGDDPWSNKARLPRPRSRFGAAAMQPIAKIYALGGNVGDEAPAEYDARSDSWQAIDTALQPIGERPGVVQQDLLLIALGGQIDGAYSTTMQAYQALSTVFAPGVGR